MKRCSTSLIINEIHFKTLRYHLLPLRMSVIKRQEITRDGKDVEIGKLCACWWDCKLVEPLWKTVWRFLKK